MLSQVTLLALVGIATVCCDKMSVEDYRHKHPELSPPTEDSTSWDRALEEATKDLTYPVENQPVPEIRVFDHFFRENKKHNRKQPKRTRERRQINLDSCYLFFANRAHLVRMQNVPSLQIEVALTGMSNAVAVDFDKREGFLFWSDVILRRIYRSRVDGTGVTELVNSDITTPDGIAWDWVSKNLYWTDAGERDLEVLNPSTGCRKVLFQFESTSIPRAIVVDPTTRYMYWTDWGTPATIQQASMDGDNRRVLHNTGLHWPNALAMDYVGQRLYWLDAALDRLETSHANGSGRTLLLQMNDFHPFSLTYYNGNLFWSDWALNALLGTTTNNVSATNIIFGDLAVDPMGLTAACASRQQIAPNLCDGKCDGKLCLLSQSNPRGYKCACSGSCKKQLFAPPTCNPGCSEHGICTRPNSCTCKEGWRGDTCNKGVCDKCMHGECIGPNECVCDDGWTGAQCDQAICCPECQEHGTCTSPDKCTCDEGWGGDTCGEQLCFIANGCANGGTCNYNTCLCRDGYTGVRCEKNCLLQGGC